MWRMLQKLIVEVLKRSGEKATFKSKLGGLDARRVPRLGDNTSTVAALELQQWTLPPCLSNVWIKQRYKWQWVKHLWWAMCTLLVRNGREELKSEVFVVKSDLKSDVK